MWEMERINSLNNIEILSFNEFLHLRIRLEESKLKYYSVLSDFFVYVIISYSFVSFKLWFSILTPNTKKHI